MSVGDENGDIVYNMFIPSVSDNGGVEGAFGLCRFLGGSVSSGDGLSARFIIENVSVLAFCLCHCVNQKDFR